MTRPLTIAVDFDGTIVEHKFPAIGNELPFATHTLKTLQGKGHRLILWTYRSGQQLDEAVSFCKERGLEFYAINKNYPEEKMTNDISRKILADVYIDDRNIGGMPSWTEIYHLIHPEEAPMPERKKSKRWWE
ncbi:BT0820 family HAD-type phosphatase [Sunxiuqinia sp. sy24]|uniref:BT0820 family HAD-type phosphatase n=1 Tax=Sunxiuqinia sp. sy24 TaxID=3461495 RepID=UPI00404571AD